MSLTKEEKEILSRYHSLPVDERMSRVKSYHEQSLKNLLASSQPERLDCTTKEGRICVPPSLPNWEEEFNKVVAFMKEKEAEYRAKKAEREAPKSQKADLPETKVIQKTSLSNNQFTKLRAGIFGNLKEPLKNPTTLLFYLLQHKTWKDKIDKHNTWSYWYQQRHLIVASRSIDQIGADFNISTRTIIRWLNDLHQNGYLIRVRQGLESIYVLGEVVDETELYLYCRETTLESVQKLLK